MKVGSSILLPIALLAQAWQAQGQLSTTPAAPKPHYTSPASPITNWDPPFHTALNHRSEGHISEAELSGDYVPDEDADRISDEVRDEVPSLEEGLTDGGSIPDAAFGGMPPAET
ncbi:hypothetical protein SAMD00023353_0401390 [Rosellinia necatrix]|uniref:Uncharacterized protein n=1 Tax=Rosellinia necatrix TaxID=77044 RepID=A0A1S8A6E9_ROSNE|nr:hypothetical protein SAMD00023353_0401390 [Rosellinia necatrix]